MKTSIVISFLLALLSLNGKLMAQSSLPGTWKGKSICEDKASACKDENVIYRVKAGANSNELVVDADRVVNGEVINMGALTFAFDAQKKSLTCTMGTNFWSFILSRNHLEGTLTREGRIFRKVSLEKVIEK